MSINSNLLFKNVKFYFKKGAKLFIKLIVILTILIVCIILIGVSIPIDNYKNSEIRHTNLIIQNCHIVDVVNGKIILNQNIIIKNGIISSINTTNNSFDPSLEVLDAKGMFLMPSLWDMHVHTISLSPQLHFPLLIANGVTHIRDMGDGDSWISDIEDTTKRDKTIWEQQAQKENILIPNIHESVSYHVEEIEAITIKNYKEKCAFLVKKLKERKEPFIKVQLEKSELPNYIFYELQYQAKKQNIPILGHLPRNLDINAVSDNGFKSIEHAWALIPYCVKLKKTFKKDILQKKYELKYQDSLLTIQVVKKIAKSNIYYVPTHITSNRKEFMAFMPNYNDDLNNIYIERTQLKFWRLLNWLHTTGYNKETDLPVLEAYYKRGLIVTKVAHSNGVKILAGSDALDRNVYHGISLHKELQEMVKAGLTNNQALQTATINAAQYYRLSNSYGSIEIGKIADFIIVEKNPLEKITNTETIRYVFFNEKLYTKDEINKMYDFVKSQAKKWNISCHFIWNMIKRN